MIYTTDSKHNLLVSPSVVSRGFIYMKSNENIVNAIKKIATDVFNGYVRRNEVFVETHVKNAIINNLSEFLYERTERKPMIIPIIVSIE